MPDRAPAADACRFWVTCYTDASFTRRGSGWAVWLRSVAGRVVRSGPCPKYVKSSGEAEMAAIFAGIFLACRVWGDAVRGVVVRTDSQEAIFYLSAPSPRPGLRRKRPGMARLLKKIRALVQERGIELDLRWVKGHQKTNTGQAFLNDACDKLARKARNGRRGPSGAAGPPAIKAPRDPGATPA